MKQSVVADERGRLGVGTFAWFTAFRNSVLERGERSSLAQRVWVRCNISDMDKRPVIQTERRITYPCWVGGVEFSEHVCHELLVVVGLVRFRTVLHDNHGCPFDLM